MNLFRTGSLALVAVLAVGCSDPAGPGAPSSGAAESPPPTSAPSMEPTGPEAPRSGDDGVAISIPQLPIGGGVDDTDAESQCASAGWLQNDLSPGPGVKVTGIRLEHPGVFSIVGGGCGGDAACAGFTFHAKGDTCSIAVRALGTGGKTRLFVEGKPECASASACRDLRDRVNPGWIDLTQPEETTEPSTSETTAPETTTTTG